MTLTNKRLFLVCGYVVDEISQDFMLFGIFDSLEKAEQAKVIREKEYSKEDEIPYTFEILTINQNENISMILDSNYD